MYSRSQKSLFSVLCPSLAVSEAVTALSPEQSCEHTRSRYCCTCTDLIPNRVSANFCSFSTQNIQCAQCTALRADMTKKALLPLSMLSSMGAILFYGHWGQTSLFFLSLFIPYHTWLYHNMCVCTGLEMSSCWLWGWGRCPSEPTCSLHASLYIHCPLLRTTWLSHRQMCALAQWPGHLRSNSLCISPDEVSPFPKIKELWSSVAFKTILGKGAEELMFAWSY